MVVMLVCVACCVPAQRPAQPAEASCQLAKRRCCKVLRNAVPACRRFAQRGAPAVKAR